MTFFKLFLIWVGVFVLSLTIGWLIGRLAPKINHITRSLVMSLILVPAIIFGVIPIASALAG